MKKTFLPLIAGMLLVGMTSCGGEKKEAEQAPVAQEIKKEVKSLVYNNANTQVVWTAFKTTDKVGVTGQFTEFEVEGTKESTVAYEVIEGASILINTESVATNNAVRDGRIVNNFFKIFSNSEQIIAKVKSLNDKVGVLEITLNENTMEVPVNVITKDKEISLEGKIDLNIFDGQAAVDSLNTVCLEVHKGADGVTKLWPDVEIFVRTTLE